MTEKSSVSTAFAAVSDTPLAAITSRVPAVIAPPVCVMAPPESSATVDPVSPALSVRSEPVPVVVNARNPVLPALTGPVTVSGCALVSEIPNPLPSVKDPRFVIWFAAVRDVPPVEKPVRVPTVIAADCVMPPMAPGATKSCCLAPKSSRYCSR